MTSAASTTILPAATAAPEPAVRRARQGALACLIALIVLGLAWELWLVPTGSGTLALKVLPLVACLAGLLRHRMYTYRWLSLLLWLYVMEGLVRATSERGLGQVLAIIEVALCVALFAICGFYIRRRLAHANTTPP